MLTSEQTLLNNALNAIASHFSSNARIQFYVKCWKDDVAAITNESKNESQLLSGHSFKSVPIVVTSKLPPASSGDEAIVTDANNVTAGATLVGGGSYRVYVYNDGTNWVIKPGTFTIATLPASPDTNDEAVVTDCDNSKALGDTAVSGGTPMRTLVRWNGSAWKVR